jgi:succinate dehydrogenase hydrophobic anchor subunit
MKKIIVLLFIFCLIFPLVSLAESVSIQNPLGYDSFKDLAKAVINFFLWLAVALAPLLIIVGAFYLMTAAGDPKRVETGRNIILWTCIGFIVILFAWGIIALVQGILGVE